jgi:serine/threonine protein kinase
MLISKQSSYASDLWAVGVIIFQFLTSELPFKGKT